MTLPFDLPKLPAPPKLTEADLLCGLRKRYTKDSLGVARYAFADHVPTEPLYGRRVADFIAVDCWRGSWSGWKDGRDYTDGWGYAIHGHEVKVSRSDWLAELRQPDKAEAFKRYCDHWWLVVSDRSIVKDGELPDGWGLMLASRNTTRQIVKAPRLTPEPMPRAMLASLLRAVAKNARAGVAS